MGARAPVRGAQSFVGVMTEVWGRPSLTGLEILWRWFAGAPILALVGWRIMAASATVHVDTAALGAMTVFKPVAAFGTMHDAWVAVLPAVMPVAMWLVPLAAVWWVVVAAVGRTWVMRRFDATLHARRGTLLVLGVLRAALLTAVWGLWIGVVWKAGAIAITGPAASGGEPDIVLYSAILICGSLFVYVLWAVVSWLFQLAPLLAMQKDLGAGASLREAAAEYGGAGQADRSQFGDDDCEARRAGAGHGVFGFSAAVCVECVMSQTFLRGWWAGAILLYMAAMDYFHVVHAVAHLWLWRAYDFPAAERSRGV